MSNPQQPYAYGGGIGVGYGNAGMAADTAYMQMAQQRQMQLHAMQQQQQQQQMMQAGQQAVQAQQAAAMAARSYPVAQAAQQGQLQAAQQVQMAQRAPQAYPAVPTGQAYAAGAPPASRASPTTAATPAPQNVVKQRKAPRLPERNGIAPESADDIVNAPRRSRRAAEFSVSKLMAMVPEARMLHALVDFEKKLDAVIQRKRGDIFEATKRPKRLEKKLRIFISNTHHNQKDDTAPLPGPSDPPPEEPSWTLFVRGFLMDRPLPEDKRDRKAAANDPSRRPVALRFTQLVSRVVIELDKELFGPDALVVWTPPAAAPQLGGGAAPSPAPGQQQPAAAAADGFEVKRKGDRETVARISITLAHSPARFKIAAPLGPAIGVHTESRVGVLLALWQYIRANGLLDTEDRTLVKCDETLRKCFGVPTLHLYRLGQAIGAFLLPADPIVLTYPIKLQGTEHASEEVYEADVDVDDPGQAEMARLAEEPLPYEAEAGQLEEEVAGALQRVRHHKHKRDFMLAFFSDPVNFVSDLVVSQHNDTLAMSGDTSKEEMRRTRFYEGDWVPQAVKRYLADASAMAAAAAASASASASASAAPAAPSSGSAPAPAPTTPSSASGAGPEAAGAPAAPAAPAEAPAAPAPSS
eukprot:tig00021326_g20290.t1